MKYKIIELVTLYVALKQLEQERKSYATPFVFACARNMQLIEPVLMAYDKARLALANEMCEKDGEGKPVIIDDRFQFPDVTGYNAALFILQNQEEEVQLRTVKETDMPAELPLAFGNALLLMVTD